MKFCAVLRTHPTDTPGGAELQTQLICSELSRRGHEPWYIAYCSDENETVEREGVTVVRMDTGGGYRGKRAVLSRTREIDPDVLYFRIIKDLPLATLAKQVTDAHIAFNVSHDAHCLSRFADWPGKNNGNYVHTGYRRLKLAFHRSLLAVPDTRFVQTKTQQRLLEENRNLDTIVTGNGHPVPDSEPEKVDPPVVLWLASLKRWKQPHVFVDIAESCRDLECEFWMVGQPTDAALAEEIEERADALSNLDYLGGCTIEESNRFIERASVFVNTSKQEGFPNTFIQSWFRKTPVVSLHADPLDQHGENGIGYYGVGDRAEMVRKVRGLIEKPENRRRIAEEAYDYACKNNDICSVVERIERGLLEDA